jgi:Family of unknown function (DUF6527)
VRQTAYAHQFVEYIPEQLDDGILYVSMNYAVASHKCACGCGCEVVTPLSPTDWQLYFDGQSIGLQPSIGNWNFACRAHYYIEEGRVRWARDMPQYAIERGRIHNRQAKKTFYASRCEATSETAIPYEAAVKANPPQTAQTGERPHTWWNGIAKLFSKKF